MDSIETRLAEALDEHDWGWLGWTDQPSTRRDEERAAQAFRNAAANILAALPAHGLRLAAEPDDGLDVERLARALVAWGGTLNAGGIVTLYDDGRVAARAIAREYAALDAKP